MRLTERIPLQLKKKYLKNALNSASTRELPGWIKSAISFS